MQQELTLFRLPREDANARWLVETLKLRGWMTRRDLLRYIGWPETETNLRSIRMVVEASGPEVVKGQRGFNHIANCTPEEISHCSNQAISQGRLMIRYGIALRRRAHQAIG